jgi:hypothetical protein
MAVTPDKAAMTIPTPIPVNALIEMPYLEFEVLRPDHQRLGKLMLLRC